MVTSEAINELAAALANAQGVMGGAEKSSANPFFKSKYADLASVWDACRGPLAANGLSIAQFPRTDYEGTPEPYQWTSKTGETRNGVRVICVVSVITRIMHASGQWLQDEVSTMLPTGDPQSVGSAITYLRRYALQSVAGVAPEDDDAEAAQGNGKPQAKAQIQAPEGFEAWFLNLRAIAKDGTPALQAAWTQAPLEYRQYLTSANAAGWESTKIIAAKAAPKPAPKPADRKEGVPA